MRKKNIVKFYGFINDQGAREYKDPEFREKIVEFFETHHGKDFEATYRIINDIKSYAQLNFYFGVVIPAFVKTTGETDRGMIDTYLRGKYLGELVEIMGEVVPKVPSLKMDKNEIDKVQMSHFITNCLDELWDIGGSVDMHEVDKLHSAMEEKDDLNK